MYYKKLVSQYRIQTDQMTSDRLSVVLRELENTLSGKVPGDVVEFGCYKGTTSLFIRRLLDLYDLSESTLFYAYDSFQGLPTKSSQDQSTSGEAFVTGELSASRQDLIHQFKRAGLRQPIIVKAWFQELRPDQVPSTIMFAFLDGDFYQSIFDSLTLVWPRLVSGGRITIDDYERLALPGVTRAVHDYFHGQLPPMRFEQTIAIIRKP